MILNVEESILCLISFIAQSVSCVAHRSVRRSSFLKVGFFETNWQVGAEMSWFLRANEAGLRIRVLPGLVLLRRIHEQNKGITKRDFITQRAHILKMALDRRRKDQAE